MAPKWSPLYPAGLKSDWSFLGVREDLLACIELCGWQWVSLNVHQLFNRHGTEEACVGLSGAGGDIWQQIQLPQPLLGMILPFVCPPSLQFFPLPAFPCPEKPHHWLEGALTTSCSSATSSPYSTCMTVVARAMCPGLDLGPYSQLHAITDVTLAEFVFCQHIPSIRLGQKCPGCFEINLECDPEHVDQGTESLNHF